MVIITETKRLLADWSGRIELHDLVLGETRELIEVSSEEHFPLGLKWAAEELLDRLNRYEEVTRDLCQIEALLAYWGEPYHRRTLTLPLVYLTGNLEKTPGTRGWIGLRWYPVLLLLYSSGVAAVAAKRYENLQAVMGTSVQHPSRRGERCPLILAVFDGFSSLGDAFKNIPGYERRRTAHSDYLLSLLQSDFEELISVGPDYEFHFDRFEVLLALEHAHLNTRGNGGTGWGPPGRFAWKYQGMGTDSPFHNLLAEAGRQKEDWEPVRAGLFGGSMERFEEVATAYAELIVRLGWH